MSRRALRRDESAVSLFPFLAVLICTMGALIVLLVVLVQQASAPEPTPVAKTAAADAESGTRAALDESDSPLAVVEPDPADAVPDTPSLEELETEISHLQIRAEERQRTRDEGLAKLKQYQMTLSRVEDQTRDLADQFEALQEEARRIAVARDNEVMSESQVVSQIARLEQEIDEAKRELLQARKEAAENRQRYAIVPYDGPNGTERRPVYVECLEDRVILQPEGIELFANDFAGQIGPNNVLAAALRAIREYHLDTKVADSAIEAYPLLIVRPKGARAYAGCRRALSGWDDEFGYELVPDDMRLEYPEPDPALALELHRVIEQARREIEIYTSNQASPGGGLLLSANPHTGGFVTQNGTAAGQSNFGQAGGPGSATSGNPKGTHGYESNTGDGRPAGPGQVSPSGQAYGGDRQAEGLGGTHSLDDIVPPPNPMRDGSGGGSARPSHDNHEDANGSGSGYGTPGGAERAMSGGSDTWGTNAPGGAGGAGSPGGTSASSSGTNSNGAGSGSNGHSSAGAQRGGAGTASAGSAGQPQAGATSGTAMQSADASAATAATTFGGGANWGLPNATENAIGITRPVYLSCTPNAIILRPVAGKPLKVSFDGATATAIQPFITALWEHIKTWGIAGNGVYWKPILKVDVKPGGEDRFAEFVSLLNNSGLEVVRR